MDVLLDTNVILDYFLRRGQFFSSANRIWDAHIAGEIHGSITASTLTDIYYLASKFIEDKANRYVFARQVVQACMMQLGVHTIDHLLLKQAYAYSGNDFEDNLQIACAVYYGDQMIITRDVNGFSHSPIRAISPDQFVAQFLIQGSV